MTSVGRPFCDLPTVVYHHHPIAYIHDRLHVVLHNDHRDTFLLTQGHE